MTLLLKWCRKVMRWYWGYCLPFSIECGWEAKLHKSGRMPFLFLYIRRVPKIFVITTMGSHCCWLLAKSLQGYFWSDSWTMLHETFCQTSNVALGFIEVQQRWYSQPEKFKRSPESNNLISTSGSSISPWPLILCIG